jgi:N-ethylmaleimide reductase
MSKNALFTPTTVGNLSLRHRFALAPMTRSRAQFDGTPGDLAAEYYAQRAGLGLLITEGTQPSADGQGYLMTPGIYTDSHVEGWRRIAEAVHEKGAGLFIQLMHAGRVSHPGNTPHGRQAVAPSAVAPGTPMFTMQGMQPIPEPRELSAQEIRQTIQEFRHAAARAVEAGADGVEIHGANGYLVQQFFASNANTRVDEYGGAIENRARFAIEVATAIAQEIGPERTGIRLSPGLTLNGIEEGEEGPSLYRYLVPELAKLNLAYLHLMYGGDEALLHDIRSAWKNPLILLRLGRKLEGLGDDVEAGRADVVSIGRWALANPDFVERFRADAPLNEADPATFYGGGAVGYTDYPTLH